MSQGFFDGHPGGHGYQQRGGQRQTTYTFSFGGG